MAFIPLLSCWYLIHIPLRIGTELETMLFFLGRVLNSILWRMGINHNVFYYLDLPVLFPSVAVFHRRNNQ